MSQKNRSQITNSKTTTTGAKFQPNMICLSLLSFVNNLAFAMQVYGPLINYSIKISLQTASLIPIVQDYIYSIATTTVKPAVVDTLK